MGIERKGRRGKEEENIRSRGVARCAHKILTLGISYLIKRRLGC